MANKTPAGSGQKNIAPAGAAELTGAVFRVKSDQAPDRRLTVKRQDEVDAGRLHPELFGEKLLKLQYGKSQGSLAAFNLGSREWIVTRDGAKTACRPGERAVLSVGTVITVLRRKLQLTVEEVL